MTNASTDQNRQRTERREGQGRLLLALLGGAVAVSALAGANLQLTGDFKSFGNGFGRRLLNLDLMLVMTYGLMGENENKSQPRL